MQCTPVNSVGYDTVFNGCENIYIITIILFIIMGMYSYIDFFHITCIIKV